MQQKVLRASLTCRWVGLCRQDCMSATSGYCIWRCVTGVIMRQAHSRARFHLPAAHDQHIHNTQGVPQAICALQLEPVAIAKAKRLGRDLSIKVNLQPSATNSTGSVVRVLECGEDYSISWPSLLFLDPISTACSLAYKGMMRHTYMYTRIYTEKHRASCNLLCCSLPEHLRHAVFHFCCCSAVAPCPLPLEPTTYCR